MADKPLLKLLVERDGEARIGLRDVCDVFEKRHDYGLESVDKLLKSALTGKLRSVFFPITYKDSTGRTLRTFEMNRDGFSLLAMGFTGETAPYRDRSRISPLASQVALITTRTCLPTLRRAGKARLVKAVGLATTSSGMITHSSR